MNNLLTGKTVAENIEVIKFKDIFDVLANHWATFTDSEKSIITQALIGTNQDKTFNGVKANEIKEQMINAKTELRKVIKDSLKTYFDAINSSDEHQFCFADPGVRLTRIANGVIELLNMLELPLPWNDVMGVIDRVRLAMTKTPIPDTRSVIVKLDSDKSYIPDA
jgi:hypothetical protein